MRFDCWSQWLSDRTLTRCSLSPSASVYFERLYAGEIQPALVEPLTKPLNALSYHDRLPHVSRGYMPMRYRVRLDLDHEFEQVCAPYALAIDSDVLRGPACQ